MTPPSAETHASLLFRIVCEFLEMPGLLLNPSQAKRLWGFDEPTCIRLLDELVDLKFLVRRNNSRYTRCGDGNWPHLRHLVEQLRRATQGPATDAG